MQKRPQFYIGLSVMYVVSMVSIFIIAPIQQFFGMWGLAASQIILLVCAVAPVLMLKWDADEVFAIKKPAWRQIFGTVVLWVAAEIVVIMVNLILVAAMPDEMLQGTDFINDLIRSVPLSVALYVVAVLPALCEEYLHRGIVLYTFQNVKNKWVVCIAMGAIFGAFHFSPYRFLPTAVLGVVLTYIMLETKNIILPMFFHFINNAIAVLAAVNASTEATEALVVIDSNEVRLAIGGWLIISAFAPFLFIWGSKLLRTKQFNQVNKLSRSANFVAVGCAVVSVVAGVLVITCNLA